MIEKARNKKAATLMKKRVIAICVTLALVAVLLIAYFCVNSLAKPTLAFDDTDGTRYFIMYRGGEYSMYTTDGEPLTRDAQLGYFVTEAGSLVDIDPETGAILALAGAIGEKSGDRLFSFATNAKRPPVIATNP